MRERTGDEIAGYLDAGHAHSRMRDEPFQAE
jgi:hypothetical protein